MPTVGRLRSPRLSSPPASPAQGEMYFDTGANKLYWWSGTAWVDASGGSAPPEVFTGPGTPPGSQVLWIDTDEVPAGGGLSTVNVSGSGAYAAQVNQCLIVSGSGQINLPTAPADGSMVEVISMSVSPRLAAGSGDLIRVPSQGTNYAAGAATFTQFYNTSARYIYQASTKTWFQANATMSSLYMGTGDLAGYYPNPTIAAKWAIASIGNPNWFAQAWSFGICTATTAPKATMPTSANATGPVAVCAAGGVAVTVIPNTGQTIVRKGVSYGAAGFPLGAGGSIELWFNSSAAPSYGNDAWYAMSDTGQ